jgi:hypothetical protein
MAAQNGKFTATPIKKRGVRNYGTESTSADVYIFIPLWSCGNAIAIDVCGASSVDISDDVETTVKSSEHKQKQERTLFFKSEMQSMWQSIILKPFVLSGLENFEEDSVAIVNRIGLEQRL